jgi:hypothetical protein
MRRALWIRIVTAMWGVWLGVALTEPMMLHPCATHGGSAAQMVGMPLMPDMDGGTAAQNSAAGHTAHHEAPSQGTGTTCTCLSDCCCAPPVLVPVSARADVAGSSTVEYTAIAPSCDVNTPVAAVPYAHPFANGPPVALSI